MDFFSVWGAQPLDTYHCPVFFLVCLQVPSGVGHFGLCDGYEVHFAAIRSCFADDLLCAKPWVKCLHASFRSGPSGWPSFGRAVQDSAFSITVCPVVFHALARVDSLHLS